MALIIKRQPLSRWDRGRLSWSTQFNDLRDPASLGETALAKCRTLLRELKRQALFESCTIIRDADLVNNSVLLKLLLDDVDELQAAFRNETHLLSIRTGVDNLTEVTDNAGIRRAHPSAYSRLRPLVKRLDTLISATELSVVGWTE